MNLPNKITMSRIFMIPIFLIFIIPLPEWTNKYSVLNSFNELVAGHGDIIATVIFVLASITDGIDGYIARKYNLVSNLGIFLDPIADKLMVASALIALVQVNRVSVWVTIIIVSREFIITGFRLIASDKKLVIAANMWGKIKTISQIILIIAGLLLPYMGNSLPIKTFYLAITLLTLFATIYSAMAYIYKNKSILI